MNLTSGLSEFERISRRMTNTQNNSKVTGYLVCHHLAEGSQMHQYGLDKGKTCYASKMAFKQDMAAAAVSDSSLPEAFVENSRDEGSFIDLWAAVAESRHSAEKCSTNRIKSSRESESKQSRPSSLPAALTRTKIDVDSCTDLWAAVAVSRLPAQHCSNQEMRSSRASESKAKDTSVDEAAYSRRLNSMGQHRPAGLAANEILIPSSPNTHSKGTLHQQNRARDASGLFGSEKTSRYMIGAPNTNNGCHPKVGSSCSHLANRGTRLLQLSNRTLASAKVDSISNDRLQRRGEGRSQMFPHQRCLVEPEVASSWGIVQQRYSTGVFNCKDERGRTSTSDLNRCNGLSEPKSAPTMRSTAMDCTARKDRHYPSAHQYRSSTRDVHRRNNIRVVECPEENEGNSRIDLNRRDGSAHNKSSSSMHSSMPRSNILEEGRRRNQEERVRQCHGPN